MGCCTVSSTINVSLSMLLSFSASLLLGHLQVLALFTARNFLCLTQLVIDSLHDLVKDCIRVDIRQVSQVILNTAI